MLHHFDLILHRRWSYCDSQRVSQCYVNGGSVKAADGETLSAFGPAAGFASGAAIVVSGRALSVGGGLCLIAQTIWANQMLQFCDKNSADGRDFKSLGKTNRYLWGPPNNQRKIFHRLAPEFSWTRLRCSRQENTSWCMLVMGRI